MIRKAWDAVLAFLEYRRAVRRADLQSCACAVPTLVAERDELREALHQIAGTREPIFADDAEAWRDCAVRRRGIALATLDGVPLG